MAPMECKRRAGLAPALLVAALALPTMAAEPFDVIASDPILSPANWTRFDSRSGVVGRLHGVFPDSASGLWLATVRGLQHYDGLRFTTWTTRDGLPSDEVKGVVKTPDGTVWACFTGHGVARLDGDRWVTYGLEDGLVSLLARDLHVMDDGTLWLKYEKESDLGEPVHAISRFESDRWVTLRLPGDDYQVHSILKSSSGELWLTTSSGVLRHGTDGWTHFAESDGVPQSSAHGLIQDAQGHVWVTFFGAETARFDGQRWQLYGEAAGLDITRTPVSLFQARDGTIWVGGRRLLARFDGQRWYSYPPDAYPGNSYIVVVEAPGQPGFWAFDVFTSTFFHFDPDAAAQSFSHPEGLSGGVETEDGAIWFLSGRGLDARPGPARAVRYLDGTWSAETVEDDFLDGEVFSMMKTTSGDLWYVGTHAGQTALARRVEDGWWLYTEGLVDPGTEPHRDHGFIARPFLAEAGGELYLAGGVDGGAAFSRFDGERWSAQILDDGRLCESVSHMLHTSNGDLWVACWRPTGIEPDRGGALFRFKQGEWSSYTELDGLASTYITGLSEWPKGTLWVGHIQGISRLDLSAGEAPWENDVDFNVPRPKPGDFLPGEDGQWFAFTANRAAGAVRYDGQSWQRFTASDGLINDSVTDIDRFADGSLWFTTRGGLSRFDGRRWLSYGNDHGVPGGTGAKLNRASDGTLWIDDGDGGVTRFRPGQGRGLPDTDLDEAPADIDDHGNLRVSWTGVDAGNRTPTAELQFEYRMDGGHWSQSAAMREITLTSMRHGEHTLEVRALDSDGNVDPTPAVHTFTVAAPWWYNRWVIGGSAAFVLLIALQSLRIVRRDRALYAANAQLTVANAQLEEANREIQLADQRKSRFLASMSHELRTPMNAIIGFTRVVLRRSGEELPERQRDNLTKVESSAEHLLGLINELLDLSKIEAGRMEVTRSQFDIRALIEACCASVDPLVAQRVTLHADVADDVSTMTSDEVKVRQIVINLLSNALKFTDAGLVQVRVATDVDNLVISVADTGIGIPADELDTIFEEFHQVGSAESDDRGTGLGLAITKRFAELLGGSIEVTSRVGEGSTFTVRLRAS